MSAKHIQGRSHMKSGHKLTSADFDLKLSECDGVLSFRKDTYFIKKQDAKKCTYSFSNTSNTDSQYAAFVIKDSKDVVIDGNGAEFIFRGHLTPFVIESSENITIKNLTIDFNPPLVAEGEILSFSDEYVDISIDGKLFPYTCRDGWLYFDIGEKELSPLRHDFSQIRFDSDLTVAHSSGDGFVVKHVEELSENKVRLYPENKDEIKKISVGELFVLRHNARLHPGIFVENCKNITFENITVHSCGGLGILTQFCENITYRNVDFLPNFKIGRRISCGRDDGMHITSCRGKVVVEGCSFLGLMDDPINIHGCSMRVEEIKDGGKTIRARYMHEDAKDFSFFARENDVINIINSRHMNVVESAIVDFWEKESAETILIHFKDAVSLPDGDYAIENISATAEFICRKNRFGSCRARGLLVSTPKKVVISENLFESSGSGILIPGDANYWYESGECHDVEISNNVFTNKCMTSMYQYTHGMISIYPIVPEPIVELPFHKNIHIKNNVFDTSDTPVLYAFSTENLSFVENTVFANPVRENVCDKEALISLSFCNNVEIRDNALIGKYSGGMLEYENCDNVITEDI